MEQLSFEFYDTTIHGPKVTAAGWQEGMAAVHALPEPGAAVIHREYNATNIKSLKYSCSTELVFGTGPKMLNRMYDAIANIKVSGNVTKASLCFSPGHSIPLEKISEKEWILPDFTDDHFLNVLCLSFCQDYLEIELEEEGNVNVTWDCFMLSSNLRKNLMLQGRKGYYTESKKRRFVYSAGLIGIQDIEYS